ncbi:MarR family winged helix-turn-helix transcriptional regulator [Isoptericola dokdonensis]|uniref:Transcriptional repressor MprA n=1 Tax=Isoptericola dokdonensis DS-3 TaxID=1300344 RepID=A0A161HXF1_9MICO|nr:MarR family transcriptional regulator [Isoptericola dokdonensis]ANC30943.1 transcriptional repressor MprA [Isoptericola dokdonensis DS-3]
MDYIERVRVQWAERLPGVDTAPAEVGARVRRIAALLDAATEADLAGRDLTRPELDLLTALRRAGRPLRAGEITTMTGAPGASITKRLDRLARAGLVERTVPERDRRGVVVALTAAGERLVDEAFPRQVDRERDALADLDETQRAELGRLLAVVLHRLDPVDY